MNEASPTLTETPTAVKTSQKRTTATHGHTRGRSPTPEYCAWHAMKQRCYDKNNASFLNYGGRGIKVCAAWAARFESFLEDLGRRPSSKYSLDRRDNGGHYSCGKCDECKRNGWPMNCRWATGIEQHNNTRQNVILEFKGKKMNLKQWSQKLGFPYIALWLRINKYGWSVEEAFTTKMKRQKNELQRWPESQQVTLEL